MDPLKQIEYDGYLDRSRLGLGFLQKDLLYSKRFFSNFQRVLINNKKEIILSVNYQFTHEYKKLQYKDDYKSVYFGEFDDDENII